MVRDNWQDKAGFYSLYLVECIGLMGVRELALCNLLRKSLKSSYDNTRRVISV